MRLLTQLRHGLRALARKGRLERELDDEVRFHIQRQTEENIARGMTPEDARYAAQREFGGAEAIKELCRDARGPARWLDDLGQDLRYALRGLRRAPGFTSAAVLTLALGIGANTAMFTLVNVALIRMLPVREPERLVYLNRSNLEGRGMTSWPHPFYRELRGRAGSVFEGVMCRSSIAPSLSAGGYAERISGELVSGNFFEVLGMQPYLGRLFTPDDDRTPGAHPVVVLSYAFWQRRFGADAGVVGRTIHLNTHPMTVVGVTPPGFGGLDLGSAPDVRVPMMMQAEMHASDFRMIASPTDWWLHIFARLRPGVSARRAEAAVQPILAGYLWNHESSGPDRAEYRKRLLASNRIQAEPAARGIVRRTKSGGRNPLETALLILLAMTGTVLLIACVNIANLLLARAGARRHETAIRTALGAGRTRLMRQWLTESLLLAAAGGAAGLALAQFGARAVVNIFFRRESAAAIDVSPDAAVLAFAAAATLLTGVGFGVAPAIGAARAALTALGAQRQAGGRRQTGRRLLVAAQVALSVILLAGAGLFVRTLVNLRTLDAGFERERVLLIAVDPSLSGYKPERILPFYKEALERISALPGVRWASAAGMPLVSNSAWGSGISVEGYTPRDGDRGPDRNVVTPDYFKVIGMPTVLGREFNARDTAGAPKVTIVNQTFARFYFGGASPLGRKIGPGGGKPEYTIVGVAKDGKYAGLREEATRFWYIPYEQAPAGRAPRKMTLHIRAAGDPETLVPAIRREIAAIDRHVPVFDVRTLAAQIDQNLSQERLLAVLAVFFGGLAALLAAVGLYGVLAYAVTQRTREIGVRMALGADRRSVIAMVLGETALMTAGGAALGIAGAYALTRFTRTLLFGVEPHDAATFAAATAMMAAVALLAGYLPARRAAHVDPAVALRAE